MAIASTELTQARATLSAAADRSASLIGSLPDLTGPVAKSDWTVAQAAAHLVVGLEGFTDAVAGDAEAWRPMIPDAPNYAERVAGLNRATIAAEPQRSPGDAARAIRDVAARFLDVTEDLPAGQRFATPWYGDGTSHTVLSATCLLAGEQLVHGYDIARGVGRGVGAGSGPTWSISPEEAVVVFEGIRTMMPLALNLDACRGLTATYKMHVGRATRFVIQIANGAAVIDPPGGTRIDCHVAGTPLALLLVGYGRISQWQAIATGRLIAWGRKPWLGFRFVNLFYNP